MTKDAENAGQEQGPKKDGRKSDGRFARGNSISKGKGKPKGRRHNITMVAESMIGEHADKVIAKCIRMAVLEGDATAMKLLVDRIIPAKRSSPITFALPKLSDPRSVADAMGELIDAVAAGQIPPDDAEKVAGLLETRRRMIETAEIAERIERLEARHGK